MKVSRGNRRNEHGWKKWPGGRRGSGLHGTNLARSGTREGREATTSTAG